MSDYVYKNQYGVFAVLDRSKMEEPKEIRFIYPDIKRSSVFPTEIRFLSPILREIERLLCADISTTTTCLWGATLFTSVSMRSVCKDLAHTSILSPKSV